MKMHYDSHDDEMISSADSEEYGFRIDTGPKAFKILSSGIYTHKIRAVIRELSCNAADAHVDAGHKDPFDIQLPTSLDPRFVIRDYGTGLDDAAIRNLYQTYFASTKTNSNDFIGALGLGSKSPFSYTDTFSVVSYVDGIARGYTAYIDKGEPKIAPTFEEGTDEPNGLKITVPTKGNDSDKWRWEARYLFRTFNDIKPNIINASGLEVNYFDPFDNYLIKNTPFEENGVYAVMGKIVYPIPKEYYKNTWVSSLGTVFIAFELGSLDINPSREDLSLDEETIEAIRSRIAEVDEITSKEEIEAFAGLDTARKAAFRFRNLNSEQQAFIRKLGVIGKFNPADEYKRLGDYTIPNNFKASFYELQSWTTANLRPKPLRRPMYGRMNTIRKFADLHHQTITVFIDDVNKAALRTQSIKGLDVVTNTRLDVIYFNMKDEEHVETFEWIKTLFDESEMTIYRVSEMEELRKKAPKVEVEKDDRPKSPTAFELVFDERTGRWDKTDLYLTSKEIRELESGVCFTRLRDDVMTKEGSCINCLNGEQLAEILALMGVKKIYHFRNSVNKAVMANENLVCGYEMIVERGQELVLTVDQELGYNSSLTSSYDEVHHNARTLFRNKSYNTHLQPFFDMIYGEKYDPVADKILNMLVGYRSPLAEIVDESGKSLEDLYMEKQKKRNVEIAARVDDFRSKNALLFKVACNRYYDVNELEAKNFIEMIKW